MSRNRKRVKVLFFDGTGLCFLAKRLDKGRFAAVYERAKDGVLQMTPSELQLFIEGSEAVGRVEVSPPLLTLSDLTPRWPGKKVCALTSFLIPGYVLYDVTLDQIEDIELLRKAALLLQEDNRKAPFSILLVA